MTSPAGGDQRKFNPHQLFLSKKLRQVDIPPRKLLARRSATLDMSMYSPRHDEETLLQKYLPYNNPQDDEDDCNLYSADQFRMYEFKVRRCTRSRSHDWTDCPFAHPGEKARRRDPRKYHYTGIICQDFRRGECPRGDNCEFAHGVFECWLHPARYRTEACKDGTSCQRKVCFFAHTSKQLRILPPHYQDLEGLQCRCSVGSPNSTLMRMPDVSPPLSPSVQMGGFSPISRSNGRTALAELAELKRRYGPGYKKELLKIMESIQAMNINKKNSASDSGSGGDHNKTKLWVDVSNLNDDDQQASFLSPSAPSSSGSSHSPSGPSSSGSGRYASRSYRNFDFPEEIAADGAPDLGWVNELLFD
ncbi:C3H1-type domain-containing protein [Heracleum sosnowskyi]|uniref:C3H1-type domain-containing protein n=1 Tax=Heracleum sosnowskyi TaxID=360622 RepID=A0AAD8JNZ0_9APIA|nr:C3H1-type domain-containing protein [Heracleum sosnowskyi]